MANLSGFFVTDSQASSKPFYFDGTNYGDWKSGCKVILKQQISFCGTSFKMDLQYLQ